MNAQRAKAAIAVVLMVTSFAAAGLLKPTHKLADTRPPVDLETIFPKRFGAWVVDDRMPVQLISPDTQAMLNKIYNQTLSRTYVGPQGERIMLSVAYGGDQSDGTRAHRPEVCYPAQGFQILRGSEGAIQLSARSLRVRQLVSKLGARIEPITYWVTVGDNVALSGTEQKLAQLRYTVRGVIPDGMLVRVSNIEPNAERAYALHQQFIRELASSLPAVQAAQIVGGAAD